MLQVTGTWRLKLPKSFKKEKQCILFSSKLLSEQCQGIHRAKVRKSYALAYGANAYSVKSVSIIAASVNGSRNRPSALDAKD